MIDIEIVVTRLPGLRRQELERWIAKEWVRPENHAGRYLFREIDVARARLIKELRDDMNLAEDALPVVLSLLDQLYDARRRLRELSHAIQTTPEELRKNLADHLGRRDA
jgi:chaperone modulatory protein CbpM